MNGLAIWVMVGLSVVGADPPAKSTDAEKQAHVKRLYPELPKLLEAPMPLPGPEGSPLTLDDLQRLARENSPTLAEAANNVDVAIGNLIQAGCNPTLGSCQPSDTNNNSAAKVDLENARLALKRARSDLSTNVRNAYFALLVSKETVRVNKALAEFTDTTYRVSETLLQEGKPNAPYEPAALRAQCYAVRLAYRQAIQTYIYNWKLLRLTIGLLKMPLTEVAGRLDASIPSYDYDAILAHVLKHHTDVKTACNGIEKARYNLKLAQLIHSSDPSGQETAQDSLTSAQKEPHLVEMVLTTTLADKYANYKTNLQALEDYRRLCILPDMVRVSRGLLARCSSDQTGVAFTDVVTVQQTLASGVAQYLTALGTFWSAAVSVADLLQTDDLFQLAHPVDVAPVPDLPEVPLPGSHPSRKRKAVQGSNGHTLDQTIWNWFFEPGTAQLTSGGLDKLEHLARRKPHADPLIFLQTAQDIAYDPTAPDKMAETRDELNAGRIQAIQMFLGDRPGGNGPFKIEVSDPAEPDQGPGKGTSRTLVPVPPWETERLKEKCAYKNDNRTPILPPIREGVPPPICENEPDDAMILRAMPHVTRGVPYFYEESRDDVQITKERIVDKIDPPRFFPLIGPAQLHRCHWKCTICYTETVTVYYPIPLRVRRPRVQVLYIDKDHLHLAPGNGPAAAPPAAAAKPEGSPKAACSPMSPYTIEPPDILSVDCVRLVPRSPSQIEPAKVRGEHLVRPDGTIGLGNCGSVCVTGLTLDQAKAAIERQLSESLINPEISLKVQAYNSKCFYVIADGDGPGQNVYRYPCTGSETVLDAISSIGIPPRGSIKKICVARLVPHQASPQILQVDWKAISDNGATETNYQLCPGDRVYIKSWAKAAIQPGTLQCGPDPEQ